MLARPSPLVETVIGCAIEVHRMLGPGLLESAYEHCLVYELSLRHIDFARHVPVTVTYKDVRIDCAFRADLIVDQQLLLELKSVDTVLPVHWAQMLTYLKLLGLVKRLTDGLRNFLV